MTAFYPINLGSYTIEVRPDKLFITHAVIPLGFFKQSPFNGSFPSAHRHFLFLSLGSIAQDVNGVSKQSESVVQSWTALLAEKK